MKETEEGREELTGRFDIETCKMCKMITECLNSHSLHREFLRGME